MSEMGFVEESGIFRHPDAEYYVEFPPGPLAVGNEPVDKIEELRLKTGILRLLSPADCVKDRLAAFYYWNDLQSLEHAVLVAKMNDIDYENLEEWSKKKGKAKAYRQFRKRISTLNA